MYPYPRTSLPYTTAPSNRTPQVSRPQRHVGVPLDVHVPRRDDRDDLFGQHLKTSVINSAIGNPSGLSLRFDNLLHSPSILELIAVSPRLVNIEFIASEISSPSSVLALAGFLDHLDRLQTLSLPGEALCTQVHQRLARSPSLRELHIDAQTSKIPKDFLTASPKDFRALETLQVTGSLSDLSKVVRACSPGSTTAIHRVRVEASALSHEKELHDTLKVLLEYCPGIEGLEIITNNLNENEDFRWMALSQLTKFKLRNFVIEHPRPLPLANDFIKQLLEAWPRARHISLNPRPPFPSYGASSHDAPPLPTSDCLRFFDKKPGLDHYGIYLESGGPVIRDM